MLKNVIGIFGLISRPVCFQEGTIGDHLVVKPVPAVYRRHVQSTTPDDEMFLDQELRDGDNEVSNQGFPLKSQKFVAHHKHVVYRRNPETDRTAGDYGKLTPGTMARIYTYCVARAGSEMFQSRATCAGTSHMRGQRNSLFTRTTHTIFCHASASID